MNKSRKRMNSFEKKEIKNCIKKTTTSNKAVIKANILTLLINEYL